MGNQIDARAKFDGGYLYVKTDRPYYYPGNIVYGKIYIRANVQFNPKDIVIRVKGKEKASYIDHLKASFDEERKFKRVIYEFRGTCFQFQGPLTPGDYTIPFEFTLPEGIPSSMLFEYTENFEEPKAEVKHTIKAFLSTLEGQEMKYKQYLNIHEPPVQFHEGSLNQAQTEIQSLCCFSEGVSGIKVTFDKNVFFQNEQARARVEIDNTKCSVAVREVEFRISQTLRISGKSREDSSSDHSYTYRRNLLESKDRQGVPANCSSLVGRDLSLNLGLIRNTPTQAGKEGKLRSKEELFMLEHIAPACHSKHIQNDYVLNVNLKYDTCTCLDACPSVSVPLTVIPLTHEASLGFVEPAGFSPTELGYFKFDLTQYQF